MQDTYCLATTLVEGAHCGVELFNGRRHGGLLRCGDSSLFDWLECRWPQETLQRSEAVCAWVLRRAARRWGPARVGWVPAEVREDEVGHVGRGARLRAGTWGGRSDGRGGRGGRRVQCEAVQPVACCLEAGSRVGVGCWLAKYKSTMRRRARLLRRWIDEASAESGPTRRKTTHRTAGFHRVPLHY